MRYRSSRTAVLGLGLLLAVSTSLAGPAEVANQIRREGCARHKPVSQPLQRDAKTDRIAKGWASGGRLRDHIPQGYGQARFASLFIDGAISDTQFDRVFRLQFCDELTNVAFSRIGVHRAGGDTWIVLSSATEGPQQKDAPQIREQVLKLVNTARSAARRCGRKNMPAVPPLTLSGQLNEAAAVQARGMAQHRKLQHEGFDGSTPAQRVTAAGYQWRATGENIAAGMATAESVVESWLDSPGHCTNIMSPQYSQMGVAFAQQGDSGVYWAQVFATPREVQ